MTLVGSYVIGIGNPELKIKLELDEIPRANGSQLDEVTMRPATFNANWREDSRQGCGRSRLRYWR